jgi:pimeloyl-ACP methyl ester carboxylesterase
LEEGDPVSSFRFASRTVVLLWAVLAACLVAAPAGLARGPSIDWEACADAEGFECATVEVPRSYHRPHGATVELAVVRLPAQDKSARIGSLFVNFGGPGADAVATLKAIGADLFASLNDRFDIVGFDPRGTGESEDAIDCRVNQETVGPYRQPFVTPENLDIGAWVRVNRRYVRRCVRLNDWKDLAHATTGNAARDMNLLRAAVGDRRLSYLGFSYGTHIGATYASLFPRRYRALVLDGAFDPDKYMNRPLLSLREQSAGFEKALARYFQACTADQQACLGFGGGDPWTAFDELVEQLDADPQPASPTDPRLVDGDDVLAAALINVYAKQAWPFITAALAAAAEGDYSLIRAEADFFYFLLEDGTYDPATDRYYALGALEQRYPRNLLVYLEAGEHSWNLFDHFWFNSGYVELPWGQFPVDPRGAYYGPFRAARSAPTTLVVGTTYDPATPYRGARRMVAQLGNARLLTMRGDGHTAYGGNSPCIDAAVDAYLEEGTLPAPRTVCRQEVPFTAPGLQALRHARPARPVIRLHTKPLLVR